VYDQELGFYSFQQETMSNLQWYAKFNTKDDVGLAEECYISYAFLLHQNGAQHGNLQVDLRNDFTTGSN
jgi:hypothetical protein